ncbi:hypothetical protein [Streptomyces sp. NPDC020747]|uniref:hypothetical protein n=1 Tax=Streptomyces sp. NPDC020747 TaxID=3365086 RepID=UPI0037A392AD
MTDGEIVVGVSIGRSLCLRLPAACVCDYPDYRQPVYAIARDSRAGNRHRV